VIYDLFAEWVRRVREVCKPHGTRLVSGLGVAGDKLLPGDRFFAGKLDREDFESILIGGDLENFNLLVIDFCPRAWFGVI
jgi:hypothetical protein